MRVLLVHNAYGAYSGEEAAFDAIVSALTAHRHDVALFVKSSANIRTGGEKIRAFFSGIHSPHAAKSFRALARDFRPDIVHIQNLYPLISTSILPEAVALGAKVVMTVQNYRLVCPSGTLYSGGLCTRCCDSSELSCLVRNCEKDWPKSAAYALRNAAARLSGAYSSTVTRFACVSEAVRRTISLYGFEARRTCVIPNIIDWCEDSGLDSQGAYVGYAGRVTKEKGIDSFLDLARMCRDIPFKVAGHYLRYPEAVKGAPPNVEFVGPLNREDLHTFYCDSRVMVVPSIWPEPFGIVAGEAMMRARPVVCSNRGGLPEIVSDGECGYIVDPSDLEQMSDRVLELWGSTKKCRSFGLQGRKRAIDNFSQEACYQRMENMYSDALKG